jgi:16S rRNA (cytosine967-C5)-methyltransferase
MRFTGSPHPRRLSIFERPTKVLRINRETLLMFKNPRALAAEILSEVWAKRVPLTVVLSAERSAEAAPGECGLVKALCYGTLRWQPRLAILLARLVKRPLKRRDRDLEALLLIGLYQLTALRVPAHAAVAETVEAARTLGKPWAAGLVNGVLRGFQRAEPELLAAADADDEGHFAHPRWYIERVRREWPADWQAILTANNAAPPLTVRVNRRRAERTAMLRELTAVGLAARPCRYAPEGIVIETPVDVHALPGFAAGLLSVQDGAAQLAAGLLDLAPGRRVLDACAAPGGKTCHILEREPDLAELVAVDCNAHRLARVRENLDRLGLEAKPIAGDAADPADWWDGKLFDRILVDAPCSGSGVIRRHPDIKLLRTPAEVDAAATLQAKVLARLWPLLAPGGMLVYVTCSIFAVENVARAQAFVAAHRDARAHAIAVAWGRPVGAAGRQVLPGEEGMDGFYYACIEKVTT